MDSDAYQIGISWTEDIMAIAITGHASKKNAGEIAQDVIKLLCEHVPDKVLVDCTKVAGRMGTIDTYYHVNQYPMRLHRPEKLAVLDLYENKYYYSFHETAAVNLGIPIGYFNEIDEALKWLRQ